MSLLEDVIELVMDHHKLRGTAPAGVCMPRKMFYDLILETGSSSIKLQYAYSGDPFFYFSDSKTIVIGSDKEQITGMMAGTEFESYETMLRLGTKKSKCECGAEKLNHPGHSDWCRLYKPHGYQARP